MDVGEPHSCEDVNVEGWNDISLRPDPPNSTVTGSSVTDEETAENKVSDGEMVLKPLDPHRMPRQISAHDGQEEFEGSNFEDGDRDFVNDQLRLSCCEDLKSREEDSRLVPDCAHENVRDELKRVASFKPVYESDVDVVEVLMKEENDQLPITLALKANMLEAAYALAADLVPASEGFTLLHLAAYFGCGEAVITILDAQSLDINEPWSKIDPQGQTSLGYTAVDLAILNSHLSTVYRIAVSHHSAVLVPEQKGFLVDENERPSFEPVVPLQYAAYFGHVEEVKRLLEKDSSTQKLGARTSAGYTALHLAVIGGHGSIVKLLLDACKSEYEKSMLLNAKDMIGRTPLHRAVLNNHVDLVKLLLEFDDVRVNEKDVDHFTPLQLAALLQGSATEDVDRRPIMVLLANHKDIDLGCQNPDAIIGKQIRRSVVRVKSGIILEEEVSEEDTGWQFTVLPPLRASQEADRRSDYLGQHAGMVALQYLVNLAPGITLRQLGQALDNLLE